MTLILAALAILGVLGGALFFSPSSGNTTEPDKGIHNYKPGSSYDVGYDFSALNVTDRSITCSVNFSVVSFGWFTTGARVGSINITVFSGNQTYYTNLSAVGQKLIAGENTGQRFFQIDITSSQLGIGPQQSKTVSVRVSVYFQETGDFGAGSYLTASVPVFKVNLTDPQIAVSSPSSTSPWGTIVRYVGLASLVYAAFGIMMSIRALPSYQGGRFRANNGRFVGKGAGIGQYVSVIYAIVIVIASVWIGSYVANVADLVETSLFGQPSLESALYIVLAFGMGTAGFGIGARGSKRH